ncbi:hypothetical protein WG66_004680 [Moniliophthora roreri]|nr:hypothetical protein WG66_004680 [Moniliophthora roreri]
MPRSDFPCLFRTPIVRSLYRNPSSLAIDLIIYGHVVASTGGKKLVGPNFCRLHSHRLLKQLYWRISFAISGQAVLAKRAGSPLALSRSD